MKTLSFFQSVLNLIRGKMSYFVSYTKNTKNTKNTNDTMLLFTFEKKGDISELSYTDPIDTCKLLKSKDDHFYQLIYTPIIQKELKYLTGGRVIEKYNARTLEIYNECLKTGFVSKLLPIELQMKLAARNAQQHDYFSKGYILEEVPLDVQIYLKKHLNYKVGGSPTSNSIKVEDNFYTIIDSATCKPNFTATNIKQKTIFNLIVPLPSVLIDAITAVGSAYEESPKIPVSYLSRKRTSRSKLSHSRR